MEMTSPRIRSLLRQAERTADAGKRTAAIQLYRQILDEAPDTVPAWLGLARVSGDEETEREAYRRVLALDPDNKEARRALETDMQAPQAPLMPPHKEPAKTPTNNNQPSHPPSAPSAAVDAQPTHGAAESGGHPPTETVTPAPVPDEPLATTGEVEETLFCYRHPNRETGLRCYSCSRPICSSCAVRTPVGYRCPECIREAQDVFYAARIIDYLVAATVALLLGLLAGAIVPRLGFFVIFIGPAAGTLIGRIAFRAARRRHGRYLPQVVAGLVALGGLLPSLPFLLAVLLGGGSLAGAGLSLLWPIIYVFLATGAAYYQVK